MAYSTAAQLRANIKSIDTNRMSDVLVNARIVEADKEIDVDVAKVVTIPLAGATPDYINLLSQFKTCELCLVYLYGAKRALEPISDISYWIKKYDELLKAIQDGKIDLGTDGTGNSTFTWDAREDVRPAFGLGEYGEFKNLEDLQEDRPVDEDD